MAYLAEAEESLRPASRLVSGVGDSNHALLACVLKYATLPIRESGIQQKKHKKMSTLPGQYFDTSGGR